MKKKQRIDAFLAHAGLGSRAQVKRFVRVGRVSIDGKTCKKAGQMVEPDQEVRVDGSVIDAAPEVLHALLHKPVGYSCSRNPNESPLFTELLPDPWQELGMQPAGRLDRDSSGMLVITSDGQLIHRLTHPGRKVGKYYSVKFEGDLPSDAVQQFEQGIVLGEDPKPTRAAQLILDADDKQAAEVILHEGKYRQIRRMFQTMDCKVVELHRHRIGELKMPEGLEPGACVEMSEEQLEALQKGE